MQPRRQSAERWPSAATESYVQEAAVQAGGPNKRSFLTLIYRSQLWLIQQRTPARGVRGAAPLSSAVSQSTLYGCASPHDAFRRQLRLGQSDI